jgi:hypothetical protein
LRRYLMFFLGAGAVASSVVGDSFVSGSARIVLRGSGAAVGASTASVAAVPAFSGSGSIVGTGSVVIGSPILTPGASCEGSGSLVGSAIIKLRGSSSAAGNGEAAGGGLVSWRIGGTVAGGATISGAGRIDSILGASINAAGGVSGAGSLGNCYLVFWRPTADAADRLLAVAPAGSSQITLSGFKADSDQWIQVRAVSACRVRDVEPERLKRVRFDASANLISPVPNAPVGLKLTRLAGGSIRASWMYLDQRQAAVPQRFNVYVAIGSSAWSFASASVQVSYSSRRDFTADLGPFDHATLVRVIVRAEASGGFEEKNWAATAIGADAQGPDAPSALEVTVA